jgi:hypothetical protein
MSPEPFYEFHPLGLYLSGRNAIAEMYRSMWPRIYPYVVSSESLTMGTQSGESSIWYGTTGLAIREWAEVMPPGRKKRPISEMAVFHFAGAGLSGETIYCNAPLNDLIREALGTEFVRIPGVTRIY